MTTALDRCTAAYGNPNVRAFLRVIREGESGQDDSAYTIINGGAHFEGWKHPFHGIPTTQGAKASGAYQFLGTTWARVDKALGLGGDFSPASQDVGAIYLIDGRGALSAVMNGDLATACAKLKDEWVSLPGLGLARIQKVFQAYGGTVGANAPDSSQAQPEGVATSDRPTAQPEKPMGALALLQMFAPMLSGMIPQIQPMLQPGSKAEKFAPIAQMVIDSITRATGQPTLGGAVQAMQADPKLQTEAQTAVVTHPQVLAALQVGEVGGGAIAARKADLDARSLPEGVFYKTSPVFWISVLLLPIVYWLVGSLIVGGIDVPDDWPWYAKAPFLFFGGEWNGESRSGGFNLVIGLILGGICGVYYGVSVTQAKQSAQQSAADKQ